MHSNRCEGGVVAINPMKPFQICYQFIHHELILIQHHERIVLFDNLSDDCLPAISLFEKGDSISIEYQRDESPQEMSIHSNCKATATATATNNNHNNSLNSNLVGRNNSKQEDIQYDGILSESFIIVTVQLLSDLRKHIHYQNNQLLSL